MAPSQTTKRRRESLWQVGDDSVESKRARNRQSQRLFRERRALYVQALESRAALAPMGQDERNAFLIAENEAMSAALIQARHKCANINASMKKLGDDIAAALERPGAATNTYSEPGRKDPSQSDVLLHPDNEQNETREQATDEPHEEPAPSTQSTIACSSLEEGTTLSSRFASVDGPGQFTLTSNVDSREHNLQLANAGNSSPVIEGPLDIHQRLSPAMPDNFPTLGDASPPSHIEQTGCLLSGASISDWQLTNIDNAFSLDQISIMAGLLSPQQPTASESPLVPISTCAAAMDSAMNLAFRKSTSPLDTEMLREACLLFTSFFASYVWPGPAALWLHSYTYAMVESATAWRISPDPCKQSYLPSYLAPTALQLTITHPPMVDWIPIPCLRDLILLQNPSDAQMDEIWLDLMAHAVVEIEDVSTLFTDAGSGPGYISVCTIFDIIESRASADTSQLHGRHALTPPTRVSVGLLEVYRMPLPNKNYLPSSAARTVGPWKRISLQELLTSSTLARQLYYHLELYNAHESWRIDPAFFEKYSSLRWDGHQVYLASGNCLSCGTRSWSAPRVEVFNRAFCQYQSALVNLDRFKV